MNLYLLRVGADRTKAGGEFWSPIFNDRSYLFIPIPEWDVIENKALTYGNYTWNGKLVNKYIPATIKSVPSIMQPIHNDPEFSTFTYGSPRYIKTKNGRQTEKNYKKLNSMGKGDILAFYAAFKNPECANHQMDGYYFFSYIVIQRVISYENPALLNTEDKQLIVNNHHYIHEYSDQVIVIGDKAVSQVSPKAVLLSLKTESEKGQYRPTKLIQKRFGYDKPLNRSSLRQINSVEPQVFKDYLDCHGFH